MVAGFLPWKYCWDDELCLAMRVICSHKSENTLSHSHRWQQSKTTWASPTNALGLRVWIFKVVAIYILLNRYIYYSCNLHSSVVDILHTRYVYFCNLLSSPHLQVGDISFACQISPGPTNRMVVPRAGSKMNVQVGSINVPVTWSYKKGT